MKVLGVHDLQQLALHRHGELLDDGGVDVSAPDLVEPGAFKFVLHLVARSDAEEIGLDHSLDRKSVV